MPDKSWKAFERRTARDHGATRIPVTGERHGADFVDGMFEAQVKLRRALPSWLFSWLDGITSRARPHGRIGVLIVKRPRMRDTDALVVLRYGDWIDLHGRLTGPPQYVPVARVTAEGTCVRGGE